MMYFTIMLTGSKIKRIREIKNLKQEYVAAELGITQQQYSEIERNHVDIKESRLRDIAKILEVKPEDILSFDGNMVFNIFENKSPTVNGTLIHHGIDKETFQLVLDEKEKHYKELLQAKNEEIDFLKQIINKIQEHKR